MEIVKINCDSKLKTLLPILKDTIENPESSEDYENSGYTSSQLSSSESEESFDSQIYNFDKELDHNEVVFLLNITGQILVVTKGFSDAQLIKLNPKFDDDLVKSLIEESKDQEYYVDHSDQILDIGIDYYIQKTLTDIPYNKVIIKYNKHFNISCENKSKWITIDEENHQLIVSRDSKKITLFDILHASRMIAITYGTLSFVVQIGFQEFKLVSYDDNTLTLKY